MNDDDIMNAIVYFAAQEKVWKKHKTTNNPQYRHYSHAITALKYLLANTNLMTRLIKENAK